MSRTGRCAICSPNAGSDISPRDRGRRAPTARSSVSIERWGASGPTASATPRIDTAPQRCHTGSSTTTNADRTARSETGPQSAAFTTSVGRTTSTVSAVSGVLAYLARIGADPHDDDETRADKALLVLISVLILPVSLLWASLYLAFGSPVGWVPLAYFAVLLASIVVFSRTRNFGRLLRVGQVAILLAPTLSMAPLGGFLDAGGVGLWGILAPLGALVFSDVRSAARWYVAYLVVFLGSGIAGEVMGPVWAPLPVWFTSTMLALNIAVGGTIVFTLLAVFAGQ